MTFKKLLTLGVLLFPSMLFAETENIGIIKGIWFSQQDFYAGDTIRVYTGIQNNTGFDVEGTVQFFDNGKSLGVKEFSALDNRVIEAWIDTLVSEGEHEFSVEIKEARKNKVGEPVLPVTPQTRFTETIVAVEIDTDGDDVPNQDDLDDDGDGFSDLIEKEKGTDSLDKTDTPKQEPPEDEKETDTNDSSSNTNNGISKNELEKILDKILGTKDLEKENIENKETTPELPGNEQEKEEILKEVPTPISSFAERSDIIEAVVLFLGSLKQKGEDIVLNQQERNSQALASQRKNIEQSKGVSNPSQTLEVDTTSSGNNSSGEKASFSIYARFFYTWLLKAFSWIFSLWWFWLIIPFVIIYLLIRLLFKIFGKQE